MRLSYVFHILILLIAYRQNIIETCKLPAYNDSTINLLMYYHQNMLVELGISLKTKAKIIQFYNEGNKNSHKVIFSLEKANKLYSYVGIDFDINQDIPVVKTYLQTQNLQLLQQVFQINNPIKTLECKSFPKNATRDLKRFSKYLHGKFHKHKRKASHKKQRFIDTTNHSLRFNKARQLNDDVHKNVKKTLEKETKEDNNRPEFNLYHDFNMGDRKIDPGELNWDWLKKDLNPNADNFYNSDSINNLKDFQSDHHVSFDKIPSDNQRHSFRPTGVDGFEMFKMNDSYTFEQPNEKNNFNPSIKFDHKRNNNMNWKMPLQFNAESNDKNKHINNKGEGKSFDDELAGDNDKYNDENDSDEYYGDNSERESLYESDSDENSYVETQNGEHDATNSNKSQNKNILHKNSNDKIDQKNINKEGDDSENQLKVNTTDEKHFDSSYNVQETENSHNSGDKVETSVSSNTLPKDQNTSKLNTHDTSTDTSNKKNKKINSEAKDQDNKSNDNSNSSKNVNVPTNSTNKDKNTKENTNSRVSSLYIRLLGKMDSIWGFEKNRLSQFKSDVDSKTKLKQSVNLLSLTDKPQLAATTADISYTKHRVSEIKKRD